MTMPIAYADWEAILREGAAFFDLALTDGQIRQLYRHAALLRQWNRTTNLTAIRDPREMAIKHFVDSLGPVRWMAPMARVLDLGSGGGFPGLPLKVWSPAIDLTLVDAVRKKTSFLRHTIRELGLKGVKVLNERVEHLSSRRDLPSFDTVVCRAFGDLAFVVTHAAPLLAPDGQIVFWKGRRPEQEISALTPLLKRGKRPLTLSLRSYKLPSSAAERTLVIVSDAAAAV